MSRPNQRRSAGAAHLQQDNDRLRRAIADRDRRLADQAKQLTDLERELAEAEQQIADAAKEIADLERQLALRQQNSTNDLEAAVIGWAGRPPTGQRAAPEKSPQAWWSTGSPRSRAALGRARARERDRRPGA